MFRSVLVAGFVAVCLTQSAAAAPNPFNGTWVGHPTNFTQLTLFTSVTVTLDTSNTANSTIVAQFSDGVNAVTEYVPFRLDGVSAVVPAHQAPQFVQNVFMGVQAPTVNNTDAPSGVSVATVDGSGLLTVNVTAALVGSQGPRSGVVTTWTFLPVPPSSLLMTLSHNLLPAGHPPVTLTLARGKPPSQAPLPRPRLSDVDAASYPTLQQVLDSMPPVLPRGNVTGAVAYVHVLDDDWQLSSRADEKLLLLSLQGLVNRGGPRLYFLFPSDWDFTFSPFLYNYYTTTRGMRFTNLTSVEDVVNTMVTTFRDELSGKYVVFDPTRRVTADAALTVAGQTASPVVSRRLAPLLQAQGFSALKDFTGVFDNKTDLEAYQTLFEQWGNTTSKNVSVWTGGPCGDTFKASIVDYGVSHGAFHLSVSTAPDDASDFAFADTVMGAQDPVTMVLGWHRYCQDEERTYTTMASRHALRVEGLHSQPNLSFESRVPATPDYKFQQHHHVSPGQAPPQPADVVYLSAVQTDGLGLGAWDRPGRGTVEYAWECTINYSWLAPGRLEAFYRTATPKDFLIGSLSVAGYGYPKAIPVGALPVMLALAAHISTALDLTVFETMDYSQGSTAAGNTDLTQRVVDAYFEQFSADKFLGFINGYSPSFTFALDKTARYRRPLVSFDYYMDPVREVSEIIDDLRSLAALNTQRPYWLLVHVREFGAITRWASVVAALGNTSFSAVPLDTFLGMAGSAPTWKPHVCPSPEV